MPLPRQQCSVNCHLSTLCLKKLHFKCTNFNFSTHLTVFWVYLCVFIKILFSSLNTMLIVDKHFCDVCCDKFPVPQIDCKCKQVKEQYRGKFYLQSVWGKLTILNTENIEICGWLTKVEAKNAICLHFLPYVLNMCRKFEFLITQGSVGTCLRWGGWCHMGFVANFIRFPTVQKFWISVNIWQSYRECKGGTFFETQCILYCSIQL